MCSCLNEVVQVFRDNYYSDVRSLLEKSKTEAPNVRFENNYKARNLLCEMKSLIEDEIGRCSCANCSKGNSMLAAVFYLHGCVSMDVDETSLAQEYLNNSLELIEKNANHDDNILTVISCLNQLGLLWCERGDYTKALEYLKESEEYYRIYPLDSEPTEFEKLLTNVAGKEDGRSALEKLHTLTLYYLAQALGATGDAVKAAAYCHRTLKRQLISPDLDRADWALNAATLSQVLVERNAFSEARSHLAAASHILSVMRSELETSTNIDDDKYKINLIIISEREAEVARCWAKYCLNLLSISRDRLLDDIPEPSVPPELRRLLFDSTETGNYEAEVSCVFALTWEDASALYKQGTNWLDKAAGHYSLESHVSDHVSIVRDRSQLYMILAFFSEDPSSQCKMHKRRLDMLKSVSEELSPQYYIDLLRQIWFEMGEICITMIDLKSDRVCEDKNNYVSKINNLIKQGISIFQKFIDSFKNHNSKYEDGYERSILLCKIHIAKLLTKIQTDDPKLLIQYNTNAYTKYKEIVEYCTKWKSTEGLTEGELLACQEMANLLPLKLGKLSARLQN